MRALRRAQVSTVVLLALLLGALGQTLAPRALRAAPASSWGTTGSMVTPHTPAGAASTSTAAPSAAGNVKVILVQGINSDGLNNDPARCNMQPSGPYDPNVSDDYAALRASLHNELLLDPGADVFELSLDFAR